MEVVYTKFSPTELVRWTRTKKGVKTISDHKITSIKIDVTYSYKVTTIEGKREWLRWAWYGLVSAVIINPRKSKKYAHISNESLNRIRKKTHEKQAGVDTKIYYALQNTDKLVLEDELECVPINSKHQ